MRITNNKYSWSQFCAGSALILTVVLTSLLAIVGVLFVMVARVDKMATSSISENRELNFAVDTVVAKISQELVMDVPGIVGQEYYDYPDANNTWLASLQPFVDENRTPTDANDDMYYWSQISDINGFLSQNNFQTHNVNVDPPDTRKVIQDYSEIQLLGGRLLDQLADADGDGIADSKWIRLEDLTSNKGRPIYAAVRVIDNGAMLNVNTAYMFDPNNFTIDPDDPNQLWRINLIALAGRPGDPATLQEQENLLKARANNGKNVDAYNLDAYNKNVTWRYNEPDSRYTPFDISDELELRYRYCINSQTHTRLETLWYDTLGSLDDFTDIPYDGYRNLNSNPKTWRRLDDWCIRITNNPVAVYPDIRHIATTYNMDRIINPSGATFNNGSMVNVNKADESLLFAAIRAGLPNVIPGSTITDANALAAQLAVNIVDLRDVDANVTYLQVGSNTYYGFEAQPFISEIGFEIVHDNADNSANNHFAIELYNPSNAEIPLGDFRLELRWQSGTVTNIDLSGYAMSDESQFVITNNPFASSRFGVASLMRFGGCKEDSRLELAKYRPLGTDPETYELSDRCDIYLIRSTQAGDIYIDKQQTEDGWFDWNTISNSQQFYSRPEKDWNIIYQELVSSSNTLGRQNGLTGDKRNYNFAFSLPYDKFITVGDIARALIIGPGEDPCDTIGERVASEPDEEFIRLDLTNPAFAGIFQYLTVIDPVSDFIDNDGDGLGIDINGNGILDVNEIDEDELKVPGRININTAPWFVIAQLPWVTDTSLSLMDPDYPKRYNLAKAIVAYRDKLKLLDGVVDYSGGRARGMWNLSLAGLPPISVREAPGFSSISELVNVTHALVNELDPNRPPVPYDKYYDIRKYGRDKELGNDKDQIEFPDLTSNDGAANDFEERDVIFSRISNLATVRSDVFTAYILVRIGIDGPQKRFIAILDRSMVRSLSDKVRILALHPVSDPM